MEKIKIYPQYLSEEQENSLLQEIRYGMLIDVLPEKFDPDVKLPVFDKIDDLYAQEYRGARSGCYFCDENIDGNAIEFNTKTYLCITCQVKLANFITALNIDPGKILSLIPGPRKIQKTRFHFK